MHPDATPERDTAAMSTTEKACRWMIVLAFWEWQLGRNVRPLPRVAWYARAIGLDPTEVFPG